MTEIYETIRHLNPDMCTGVTVVVYDGECPFCKQFANYLSMKAIYGELLLVNARSSPELQAKCKGAGFDLDEGFLVIAEGQLIFGTDGMRRLAVLPWIHTGVSHSMKFLFRPGRSGERVYAILAFGRRVLLRMMGRKTLAEDR